MGPKDVNEVIKLRRSTVAFSTQKVEGTKLEMVFEAARWSASANNVQPWRFIVATKESPHQYDLLFGFLAEGNKRWVKNAPVIILTVAETIFSHNNQPNYYSFHDVGMATSNLILRAVSLGLAVHPMGGFDKNKAKSDLKIPDPFQPVAMLALGYPGTTEGLPDDLKNRENQERTRKNLNEIVYEGGWGSEIYFISGI
jgi:nitroreductase